MTVHVRVDELHKAAEATRSAVAQAKGAKQGSATDKIAQIGLLKPVAQEVATELAT